MYDESTSSARDRSINAATGEPTGGGPIGSEVSNLEAKANALIDLADKLHAKLETILFPSGAEATANGSRPETPITCKHQGDLSLIGSKMQRASESLLNLLKRIAL